MFDKTTAEFAIPTRTQTNEANTEIEAHTELLELKQACAQHNLNIYMSWNIFHSLNHYVLFHLKYIFLVLSVFFFNLNTGLDIFVLKTLTCSSVIIFLFSQGKYVSMIYQGFFCKHVLYEGDTIKPTYNRIIALYCKWIVCDRFIFDFLQ